EYTPVAVDVSIPFQVNERRFSGAFELSDGRRADIALEVRAFALPSRATFLCEMNTYGMPDSVADYIRLQEIAYEHRLHVNILHYGHHSAAPGARKCVLDMRLASGRRMDEKRYNDIQPGATAAFWDDFAEAFGPLLTGQHFADKHRGAVPLPGFYLTFHESWPLHVRAFFNGDPDAYRAFASHPEYARTFVAILQDFIRTAQAAKWEAGFQVYLNNKGSLREKEKAPWVLDEPASYWDYRALAYYADLVRQAKGERCPINLRYRLDISRPEFARGELDGKADLWVVSTSAMKAYQRLVNDRMEQEKLQVWLYGAPSPAEETSRAIHAWALECYRLGASGLVPWQTVVRDPRALAEADPLALFILDSSSGRTRALSSLRLKAFRRGQQDIEYLELLRQRRNLTRPQMALFMDRFLPLSSQVRQADEADAGTAQYDNLSPEAFRALR
ncbi:MAG: DUF4091 domain-containing protein, partial [Planctomycetota bacterium]|nr:DUF4091 domain-containing protein [Planctomycetota bacterium]